MSETRHTVDPRFVFQRQGKDVVLYQGLLDAAHRAGLAGISTEILQYPSDTNGQTTFARAVVTMENGGRFTGIADANPGNVGKNIAPHAPRMAETRAKARALRDALNVGMVTVEELGGNDDADDYAGSQAPYQKDGGDIRPNRAPQPAQRPQTNGSAPTRAPQPPPPQRPPQQATPALAPDDPLAAAVAKLRAMETEGKPWDAIKKYAEEQWELADDYGKEIINSTAKAIKVRRKVAAPVA